MRLLNVTMPHPDVDQCLPRSHVTHRSHRFSTLDTAAHRPTRGVNRYCRGLAFAQDRLISRQRRSWRHFWRSSGSVEVPCDSGSSGEAPRSRADGPRYLIQ